MWEGKQLFSTFFAPLSAVILGMLQCVISRFQGRCPFLGMYIGALRALECFISGQSVSQLSQGTLVCVNR